MSETIEARWEQHNEAGCRYFGQGAYAEAEQEFAAAIREATALGSESLRLASSLSNLGQLKFRQRDFAEAEQLFRRSLAIRERALGSDHYGVVQSLNNLAMLYYSRGELDAAEPLFRRALDLSERHLGGEHPDVATSLSNLARLLFRRNDFASAAPLLSRLLVLKEAERGASHPEVGAILASLAKVRFAQHHYQAAEPLARRALSIRERTVAPDDPVLASSLHLLADICKARGNHDEERILRAREHAVHSGGTSSAGDDAHGAASSSESVLFVHGTEPIAPPMLEHETPAPRPRAAMPARPAVAPRPPAPPLEPPIAPRLPPESIVPIGAIDLPEPKAGLTSHPAARAANTTRSPSPAHPRGDGRGPSVSPTHVRARSTRPPSAPRESHHHRSGLMAALIKLAVVVALLLAGVWLAMGRPPLGSAISAIDRSVATRATTKGSAAPQP